MIYKPDTRPFPRVGPWRKRFAFWPVKINGYKIWLERYEVRWTEQKTHDVIEIRHSIAGVERMVWLWRWNGVVLVDWEPKYSE